MLAVRFSFTSLIPDAVGPSAHKKRSRKSEGEWQVAQDKLQEEERRTGFNPCAKGSGAQANRGRWSG